MTYRDPFVFDFRVVLLMLVIEAIVFTTVAWRVL
jgi:hypothetical protein